MSYLWWQFVEFWSQPSNKQFKKDPPEIQICSGVSLPSNRLQPTSHVSPSTTNLLSLTQFEEVKSRLLFFVSEGGLKDLLNLRLVCSTMKAWIDSLPSKTGQSLFAKAYVNVDLTEKGILKRFQTANPPPHVTSLYLHNLQDLARVDNHSHNRNRFIKQPPNLNYVKTLHSTINSRLQDLGISVLTLPLNSKISRLIHSTNVKKLRCDFLYREKASTPWPDFFFELEELHLVHYDNLDRQVEKALFEGCAANDKLRVLTLYVTTNTNFPQLADLINDPRRKFTKFYLKLHDKLSFDSIEVKLLNNFNHFLTSISDKMANVRFTNINTENLLKLKKKFVPKNDFLNFSRSIHSLQVFGTIEFNTQEYEMLTNFTNLENLFISYLKTDKLLPKSLRSLSVGRGLPSLAILPEGLISLTIGSAVCSYKEIIDYLIELDQVCPLLQTLWLDLQEIPSMEEPNIVTLEISSINRFQKLRNHKLVVWKCDGLHDSMENSIRQILFCGMKSSSNIIL